MLGKNIFNDKTIAQMYERKERPNHSNKNIYTEKKRICKEDMNWGGGGNGEGREGVEAKTYKEEKEWEEKCKRWNQKH